jgi:predicted DNA-binding transcriptional regulator YafY
MPRRNTTTAEAQLERILYILPVAARDTGVRIDELARALDVEPAMVLRDLEAATARTYYHPGGTVESFSILIDGRKVHVHAPHEFRRPIRLNEREALALGLGLRALAADAEPERRAEILALAARLEQELAAPHVPMVHEMREEAAFRVSEMDIAYDVGPEEPAQLGDSEAVYEELTLAFDNDDFRAVIADAIELHRVCTISYLKPGDDAPAERRIAPYRLVYADGLWYVLACDAERDALRYFRMDRVLAAALTSDAAPPEPDEVEALLARGAPYAASDDIEVTVRYSPRVARWIAERTDTQLDGDGTVTLQHRVADPRWIVRHVLQYAGEAVVERPREARRWVNAAAKHIAYSDGGSGRPV